MKIIFLDIDGVLNSHTDFLEAEHYGHPHNKGYKVISPGKLYLLEYIIKETDAKIVISSSWRNNFSLKEIHDMFTERGFTLPRTVIVGKTDKIRVKFSTDVYDRSAEISAWLDSRDNVSKYVILDDTEEKWFEERHHDTGSLVITNPYNGLNQLDANRAISILGRTEEAQKRFDDEWNLLRCFIV